MPRPLRIQYENAYYHVMNRGRMRQNIFHGEEYFQAFLYTLEEASSNFGLEIHAYCLMANHYHLFVKTPRANLDRCMRHLNGVYTQRYNRLKKVDGPLFRGRYKAVVVEADAYGLQLSRYIHRNPIETKKPLVSRLDDYVWSSYSAYLNKAKAPDWLRRKFSYGLLGSRNRYQAYKDFVERGNDKEILDFYDAGKLKIALGGERFTDNLRNKQRVDRSGFNASQGLLPSIDEIVRRVSEEFDVDKKSIYKAARGRGTKNIPRWIALQLCRKVGDCALNDITKAFNMNHVSGVNHSISKLKIHLEDDGRLRLTFKLLVRDLTP